MTLLRIERLALRFGGLKAVDDVGFSVEPLEIFAIVGPNGAGKTTIFNLISRIYTPTSGAIALEGRDITRLPGYLLPRRGVARTFQNIELFAGSTVLANILLGCHVHRRTGLAADLIFTRRARRQEQAFRERAEEILAFLELGPYRDAEVASLPYGIRKTVELARALAIGPKLLLLDEPSSGLNVEETHRIGNVILAIRDRFQTAIVMVEHDMNLVARVSDRVLALVAGRVLRTGTAQDIRDDPAVKSAFLGGA